MNALLFCVMLHLKVGFENKNTWTAEENAHVSKPFILKTQHKGIFSFKIL